MRILLNQDLWILLNRVNSEVNARYSYMTDLENYDVLEYWTNRPKNNYLDCDDYALVKQDLLIAEGIPEESMAICTCDINHDGITDHAILMISTSAGDYALGNIYNWVMPYKATGYTWKHIPNYLKGEG